MKEGFHTEKQCIRHDHHVKKKIRSLSRQLALGINDSPIGSENTDQEEC